MTNDEWNGLAMLLDKGFKWREPFGKAQDQTYRLLLDGFDAAQIAGALRALVAKGQVFGPTPGEIVELLRGPEAVAPTFEEMLQLVYGKGGILRARPQQTTFPSPAEQSRAINQARVQRAKTVHPLVGSFAVRYGLDSLFHLPLNDPEWGGVRRRELEEAWSHHVEAQQGRELAEIAAGVDRGRGELARFDPLLVLNGRAPVRESAGEIEAGR